jgi:choline dehydrogenase-like flavoprotein
LSGIGPSAELKEAGIEVVHDLPGVGKNLQDHLGFFVAHQMTGDFSERAAFEADKDRQRKAAAEWAESKTGDLKDLYSNVPTAYIKMPKLYDTEEFKALDADMQEHMRNPVVPHYEIGGMGNYGIPAVSTPS